MRDLDAQLLAAHAADDKAALVALYQIAARQSETVNAKGFYLTHAYVYALELDHIDAPALRAELQADGREA